MRHPIKATIVIGTRPEVTKLAPVALELRRYRKQFRVSLVGTGQHRDLVPQHLRPFRLRLDADLGVMKRRQSLAEITARTARRMDALLAEDPPDVVLVEGDTTAVLAAGLAAFYRKIPVAHVEAGLRSGDIYDPFPEEMNRRLVGGLAEIHFAPTASARQNLLSENVPADRVFVTGNTAVDALLIAAKRRPERPAVPAAALRGRRVLLVTAHRRESWDRGIREICLALRDLLQRFPDIAIVYPVHPNPIVRDQVAEVLGRQERVHLIPPAGYVEFVDLMKRSYLILTDSGGVQEEAPSLGKPILVMREKTERTEGIEAGCSRLVGPDRKRIVAETSRILRDAALYEAMVASSNPYGDGKAASRIRRGLAYHFGLTRRRPRDFGGPAGDQVG
jgi:UDP-N-acetylglucosamine 2-epimerase (non-hydrolysing)